MLEPLARNALMLETLQLFRRVTGPDARLDDPSSVRNFLRDLEAELTAAQTKQSIINGLRAQALFAQLVVALDGCQLMVTVDAGDIYADGPLSSGDFLLVLRDGRRLLVEVKSVSRKLQGHEVDLKRSQVTTLRGKEVQGLRRTSRLLSAEPYYATYFDFIRMWALVPLERLRKKVTNYELTWSDAMMGSALGILGDRAIGVLPPIEITAYAAAGVNVKASSYSDDTDLPFEVDRREVRVGGIEVTDGGDQELAVFLAVFSDWGKRFIPEVSGERLLGVRLVAEPVEPVEDQDVQIVGALSHLYSYLFMANASNELGEPTGLDIEATPSLLARLLSREPEDRQFPVWIFDTSPREVASDDNP